MRECEICFKENVNDSSIVFLECAHSLCKSCYNRLLKDECPFCRSVINREKPESKKKHSISLDEYILRMDQKMYDHIQRRKKINRKIKKKYKNLNNPSNNKSKNNKLKNKRKSLRKNYDENSSKKEINKNKYIFTKGYKKNFKDDS
jgi:hypothetical protein